MTQKRLTLGIFLLTTGFLLTACQPSATVPTDNAQNNTTNTTKTPTEQSNSSIDISEGELAPSSGQIKEETSTLIVDAVYPITGNAPVDLELKQFVQQNIDDFKKEAPSIEPGSNYSQNSIYITFTRSKLFNQDKYQSFKFDISTYTGGAHPNTAALTMTFKMPEGTRVKLADLFTPDVNYLKNLSTISRESLKEQLQDMDNGSIDIGTEASEGNFASWTLDGENLLLHFDPYQVAPYAAGPQLVTIKLADLGNILLPEFQKAPPASIPEVLTPSRAAAPGCEWQEFSPAKEIGLRLLVENCPAGPFLALRKGKIVSHNEKVKIGLDALPDENFNTIIEVFSKPINQTAEQALQSQFLNSLSAEEKANCEIKAAPEYSSSGKRAFIISATPDYLKKLGDGDVYPEKICGGYDQTDGIRYFEFQDFNAEKFIFIRIGDLKASFDQKNVYILPSSPTNVTSTAQQLEIKDL